MKKNTLLSLVTALFLAAATFAQPGALPKGDAYTLLAGSHTPVIYSGSGTVSTAASLTTSWLQIGYSPSASTEQNNNIGRYDPRLFAVGLKLACNGSGDSARITSARFEVAYDTTRAPFWCADSSNQFIKSAAYNDLQYGIWKFETLGDTSRSWIYPLRVVNGGYLRLVFATITADTASVQWTLTGEQ
jgi:hypothetical protein